MNWDQLPNFGAHEFRCQCGCDADGMDEGFMISLQRLRTLYKRSMTITSGYRCPNHPAEQAKQARGVTGTHTLGKAADIAVSREDAFILNRMAAQFHQFTGVGFKQTGTARFIHLDTATPDEAPRPMLWSY